MCLDTCLDINIGNTYSIATQCGQMSEAFCYLFVKVVKIIANKAQKSNFNYYKLQMCTSNQTSQDLAMLALEGGWGRPDERPFHGFVFIKGNNVYHTHRHPKPTI